MTTPPMEFIHACYIPTVADGTKEDAIVIKTHLHKPDGTVVPTLKVETNLERSFYVTKPKDRNYIYKKEWEEIEKLDLYRVKNKDLIHEIDKVVNRVGNSFKRKSLSEVCSSPYVYGADIHIESLLKKQYQDAFEASGLTPTKITTGFFDIETDMTKTKDPNIITVTHENRVYTAIREDFLTVRLPDGTIVPGNMEDFIKFSKATLDQHIEELVDEHIKKNPKSKLKERIQKTPFEYYFFLGKTSVDCIKWIFAQAHENKTDFLGIWNLDFDIPLIIETLKRNNVPLEDVFCPPQLPKKFRYVRYERDDKETADIFKKWHWLHTTAYFQFVDSQCLYRILRTVKGLETSMSLDNILKSNDLGGKLTFKNDDPNVEDLSGGDWHRYMQRNEAYKYIVYNQFDCISLQLMEWKNDDLNVMTILGGVSRLCNWKKQTRKVSDSIYFYALKSGLVTASPGPESVMNTEFDKLIQKIGGAVLRPERTRNIGLHIFKDRPDIETYLHNFVSDVDFSGMYPVTTMVGNISKETKLSTAVCIMGMTQHATRNYYSLGISMQENAVFMGTEYFKLPTYQELDNKFRQYLKTI